MRRFSATLALYCKEPSCSSSSPPEAPSASMCCMSGCANCVWLEHADRVVEYYTDPNKKTAAGKVDLESLLKQVDEQIDDDIIKAFIKTELKFKFKHLQR